MGLQGKNLVSGLNGVNREEGDELRKKMSFTNPEEDDEFQNPGFRKRGDASENRGKSRRKSKS
jgi:hypothetical protein